MLALRLTALQRSVACRVKRVGTILHTRNAARSKDGLIAGVILSSTPITQPCLTVVSRRHSVVPCRSTTM